MRLSSAILAMAAMLACFPSSAWAASQGYAISHFTAIRLLAPVEVHVKTGGGVSANAIGDRRLLDRLDMSVSGGLLTIRLRPPTAGERTGGTAGTIVSLSTDRVAKIMLAGSGRLRVDSMRGMSGEITIQGSGTVEAGAVQLDRLRVMVAGAGGVTLAGKVLDAKIDLLGAGMLEGEDLNVGALSLNSQGAGSATVSANKAASISASGSGEVTVQGKPQCKVTHSGTGTVRCGGNDY